MATVTHNSQCFQIDGKKVWILGATLHYARIPHELWADRVAAVRQAGFNAIDVPCAWTLHEPKQGRYTFEDQANVRRFVEICAENGLYVLLRPGPFIGDGYDGGGLPGWLLEIPEARLRESEATYRGSVVSYLRKLLGQVADLQVTDDGPILLVQAEHAWNCANQEQADTYLLEVVRSLRESGVKVPLTNANDLWQSITGTTDLWRGWSDLMLHMRQLRSVLPNSPQIVSQLDPTEVHCWGDEAGEDKSSGEAMWHVAESLASGAQMVVSPFHAGTCFGFSGGRLPGRDHGTVTPSVASDAPLGEAGERTDKYNAIRRIVTFADHYRHVFADLESGYQPVAMDVSSLAPATGGTAGRGDVRGVSIVPQRGDNGRVIFAFGDGVTKSTTVVLDNGLRMPIFFGDQPVTWFVLDADLAGAGWLDYTNIRPFAIVRRNVVIFQGPARTPALISISGSPIETTVPGGSKPIITKQRSLTVVICNEEQIDQCYFDEKNIYFGVAGLTTDGKPIAAADSSKAYVMPVDGSGSLATLPASEQIVLKDKARAIQPNDWEAAPAVLQSSGESPRFASLAGPETLAACGALEGYGWYRLTIESKTARKRLCHIPAAGDRMHLYLDGEPISMLGIGPEADPMPFELKLGKGEHTLVALVDNFGRFAGGNDMGQVKGFAEHLYEVKALRSIRPKKIEADIVDPFELRGYIEQRARGIRGDTRHVSWSFTHLKKAPLIVEVMNADLSGVFLLNDQPIEYYAGNTGGRHLCLVLDPASEQFKRGKNELRFAPDVHVEDPQTVISEAVTIYETVDIVSEKAKWSFAKWEAPPHSLFDPFDMSTARVRSVTGGVPCWWTGRFTVPNTNIPCWLDVSGLSKGQAYVNGHNIGRYFTATSSGKSVGPQTRLYLPEPWLKTKGNNTITLFDEHGFAPNKVKIIRSRG